MPSQKPILIAGAGLASLLLAQSLRRASIPFLIYERDASLSFRGQGYRLRLSAEGLDAIESVLAPADWQTFWDACGKTAGPPGGLGTLDAISGEEHRERQGSFEERQGQDHAQTQKLTSSSSGGGNGGGGGDAEKPKAAGEKLTSRDGKTIGIARGDMRRLFMAGCEPNVKWSHKVTGYEVTPSGVRILFADGSKSEEGEMLVGGEGIYSKTAKQLAAGAIKTYDTGARGIHGQAPATAFKELGEGVWRIVDDSNPKGGVSIITNVRPGELTDDLELGWTMVGRPGAITAPGDDYSVIGKPAADLAQEITANWHSRFKPLFERMIVKDAAFWKITCSTPTGVPVWKNEPRVTLIGDAVHSMTPAGGIGANTAVRDSALLGKLITDAGGYDHSISEKYEKEMRVYASQAVGTSYGLAQKQFGVEIDENSRTV